MLECAESPKKFHIISGSDLGVVEKNIINKELGVLDIFNGLAEYRPKGAGGVGLAHLEFCGKIIYVLGYGDRARWKKVLGGSFPLREKPLGPCARQKRRAVGLR
jgi:hypothetical protein